MPNYIGLIDCNNFFASCERVFQPALRDKPVVVLSNNDGCIVARTDEIKRLGVPMAAPYFKWKEVLARADAAIFSANFALYSDLSRRIVNILEEEAPEIEVYSIDESFVGLDMLPAMAEGWARKIRARILREIGVPVSIGLAATKTLAKAGSEFAKKHPASGGVKLVGGAESASYQEVTSWLPVDDIWGIGRRLAPKLKRSGLYTALALTGVANDWARANLSIRGEKTVRELRGEPCYKLNETDHDKQKSMLVSRSFGQPVRNLSELEVAIASFSASLAHKLRRHGQLAASVHVFATSSRHKGGYRAIGGRQVFDVATSDNIMITKAAVSAIDGAFEPGVSYKRAGVYVGELKDRNGRQLSLFSPVDVAKIEREERLGEALEQIEDRWGRGSLTVATSLPRPTEREKWRSMSKARSREYTTRWDEIPSVLARNPL